MRILLVEPGKKPVVREIDGSLKSMQEIVGGTIQALYPFEEPVALICNDEGKLLGLPLNRALWDEEGRIYDIVTGTFFLCGIPKDGDCFDNLSKEQIKTFEKRYRRYEYFLRVGKSLICLYSDNAVL